MGRRQDLRRAFRRLIKASHPLGQGGFTLPFVLVMVAVSLVAVSSVTFLATHFRSITSAEDGERIYYALDANIEAVLADLVRGADPLGSSYSPPVLAINDLNPGITFSPPDGAASPPRLQQYFDPGLRHPDLVTIREGEGYLLHIFNVHPGVLQANWSFDITAGTGATVSGKVTLKVLQNALSQTAGRVTGCPTATAAAITSRSFDATGTYFVSSGGVNVAAPGAYSIAFCVDALTGSGVRLTTRPFLPAGRLTDTWVYAIAFKDYKITSQVGGASLTAHVRQMPGPTQPPAGGWSAANISWITNRVTPYQWER